MMDYSDVPSWPWEPPVTPFSEYRDVIQSVIIEEGITGIGDCAFSHCSNIQEVTLPSSVTRIGSSAFYYGEAAMRVNITDLAAWCNIDFEGSHANPLYTVGSLWLNGKPIEGNLVLPTGITQINSYAFCGLSGVTSVTLPETVTTIGAYAFEGCADLSSITLPNRSISIGKYAFEATAYYSNNENWNGVCLYAGRHIIASKDSYLMGNVGIRKGTLSIADYALPRLSSPNTSESVSLIIPDSVLNLGSFVSTLSYDGPNMVYVLNPACKFTSHVDTRALSGHIGSTAQAYAKERNIPFYPLCSCTGEAGSFELIYPPCEEGGPVHYICKVCNITKELGNILAANHLFADGSCTSCGATDLSTATVNSSWTLSHSLNLASDISINYVIEEDLLAEYDSFYLQCKLPIYEGNKQVGSKTMELQPELKAGYYYFTLEELSAVQMADEIHAVLVAEKDGALFTSLSDSYSIATYAFNQLNADSASPSLKSLCANLLRYGSKAQSYKGYRTDSLADSGLTEAHTAYLTDLDAVAFGNNNRTLADIQSPEILWRGKSLVLGSKVVLRYVINAADYSGDVSELKLKLDYTDLKGNPVTVFLTGATVYGATPDLYAFDFDTLPVAELRSVVSAAVYRGETQVSDTLYYSVDTYGSNRSGDLKALCQALLAYSDSAKDFFLH